MVSIPGRSIVDIYIDENRINEIPQAKYNQAKVAKERSLQQVQADSSYVGLYGTCPGYSERMLNYQSIMEGKRSKMIGRNINEASRHVDACVLA